MRTHPPPVQAAPAERDILRHVAVRPRFCPQDAVLY